MELKGGGPRFDNTWKIINTVDVGITLTNNLMGLDIKNCPDLVREELMGIIGTLLEIKKLLLHEVWEEN